MTSKELCFVVGPIGAEGSDTRTHADWLYEGIIKPALAGFPEFGEPVRADKIAQPGMITTQVIEMLLEAKLVIADLSLLNPNAFYEIGIRHMAQKPIIHMQLKHEAPPFDVTGYRAIKFSIKHPADLSAAQRELADQIRLAVSIEHKVENPVTHARGAIRLEETATPEQKVLLEEMRSISERLSSLEVRATERAPTSSRKVDSTILRIRHMAYEIEEFEKLKKGISGVMHETGLSLAWSYRDVRASRDQTIEIVLRGNMRPADVGSLREKLLSLDDVVDVRVIAGVGSSVVGEA